MIRPLIAGKALVLAFIVEILVLAVLALAAADMVAHRRVERLGGVNVWGYRGPVMRQPQPNEIRLAVVGGDLAFGWGVAASETLPYAIRQLVALEIDRPGRPLRPVTAVNLGAAGLPVAGYAAWMARFAYVRPQVICVVLDPTGRRNTARWQLPDRRSAIFGAFGYSPILPLVLEEKGGIAQSRSLMNIGRMAAALDHLGGRPISHNGGVDRSALVDAVDGALAVAPHVVVVLPPYVAANSADDLALRAVAAERFAGNRRVRIVALGDEASMYDVDTTLDGFHFSAAGHAAAAAIVAPVVLELIAS